MTTIKFGTDGWRAIIAEDFTFDNVRACSQAVVDYLKDRGLAQRGLVVGYDTRFGSADFAAAVAEVAAGNEVKTYLCPRPSPTQVVSYAVLVKKAGGAVVITASHNPPQWNGFKYKSEYAGSASPQVVAEIESRIPIALEKGVQRLPLPKGKEKGLVEIFDPTPAYLDHLRELVDLEALRQAGLVEAADAMFGAGAGYFPALLGGSKTQVREIHAEANPLFPGMRQPEPIPPNIDELCHTVRQARAQVGLATDGDADRIGVVDERGRFITQLQVFALLALYLLEVRGERGPIIKTVTTTSMTYRLGERYGVPVYETPVGFKYIGPKMLETGALIGGEESGGFGFRGHIPERDGILAGLYILDFMVKTGKTPSQLVDYLYSQVGPHHYDRIDFPFPASERSTITQRLLESPPQAIEGVAVTRFDTTDGFRYHLADGSWLLIRFSGTEPILRIYGETSSPERVRQLLEAGKRLVGLAGPA